LRQLAAEEASTSKNLRTHDAVRDRPNHFNAGLPPPFWILAAFLERPNRSDGRRSPAVEKTARVIRR